MERRERDGKIVIMPYSMPTFLKGGNLRTPRRSSESTLEPDKFHNCNYASTFSSLKT